MFDIASNPDAILAHHARLLIHDYTSSLETRDTLLPLPPRAVAGKPVGILGAGVGGLYTAVILQSLNVKVAGTRIQPPYIISLVSAKPGKILPLKKKKKMVQSRFMCTSTILQHIIFLS